MKRIGLLLLALLVARPLAGQQTPPDSQEVELERRIARSPGEARLYLMLGQLHYEAGRLEAAEFALRRGIERARDATDLRWTLTELLIRGERWAEAIDALEPLAPDPAALTTLAQLRVNDAIAAYEAGRIMEARTSLERAVEEDPTLPEASVLLGQILVELGDLDSARRVAERGLQHSPGDGHLLAVRSSTLEGLEGLEAAIEAARALRSADPGDEGIGLELARLLLRQADLPGAMAIYDTLLAGPRPGQAVYEDVAGFWLGFGQPDTAVVILSQGVDHYPSAGTLWEQLGDAEWEREEWRGAALAYRMAAARLKGPERVEMAIADANTMAGDTAAALADLLSMHERPAPRDAQFEVAERMAALGDTAGAERVYSVLIERSPNDGAALEGAAKLAEAAGDDERALELYRRSAEGSNGGPAGPLGVLRLAQPDPDSAQQLLRLALWRAVERVEASEAVVIGATRPGGPDGVALNEPLSRLSEDDPARRVQEEFTAILDMVVFETEWGGEELARLRRTYPHSLHFRFYAARLAAHQGRFEEALEGYDRLITVDASNVELQLNRARTLEELGRLSEARAAYMRTLELVPNDEEVYRALVRLHQVGETLPDLLEQIRRLQRLEPELEILVEREVELLHRLGRLGEAREVARKHQERDP